MSKKPKPRKQPKRKPQKPQLDDDLATLAEVLDQHRLDNNAEGWLSLPWHDGWNAVALAVGMMQDVCDWPIQQTLNSVVFIYETLKSRDTSPEIYWRIAEIVTEHGPDFQTNAAWRFMYAALRCLQVLLSNSHGGGSVYNTILRRAFDEFGGGEAVENVVMKHRCVDALKIRPGFEQHYQKEIGAFAIAWRRGLYHAAYSIKPAAERKITVSVQSTWMADSKIPSLSKGNN